MNKTILTPLNIRFKDIDAMGHVNNAVYITFFEEGRKAFLKEVLGVTDPSGYSMILATISCEYIKPLCITDDPLLEIWVADIGKKSFRFKYRVLDRIDNKLIYAKGESVMVAYNYKEKHSMLIPQEFVMLMEDFTESCQGGD
jgi:acyl-CoA thioester hydrolase